MNALDALGNPVRREIVTMLLSEPRSVAELAEAFPVSRPAISRHLRVLSEAGLVSSRSDGRRNVYAIRAQGFNEAADWLSDFWDEALIRFKLVAENR